MIKLLINYLNWLAQLRRTNELEDARTQLFICIENIWPEDVSTHEPKDTRMWGCEGTNKHTWTWGYEDVRMRVYKLTLMNLRAWWCKDTSKHARMHCKQGHINMRIQGYKDVRIQAIIQKHKDMRMQGCEDTSKSTET